MHDSTSTPHGSHDKRSRQKSFTKTSGTRLFKFLATICAMDSVGASSARLLSTDTSSAQPTTIPGVLSPCLASPRTSPEEPHRSPLTFHPPPHSPSLTVTAHRSPLTSFTLAHPHPTDKLVSD